MITDPQPPNSKENALLARITKKIILSFNKLI